MKVILRTDVDKLGKLGEVVDVSNGYARNFLLPRQLALLSTPDAEFQIQAERKRQVRREQQKIDELKRIVETLNGRSVTISVKAQEEKLYGSVGAPEIVDAIQKEHKVAIPESAVVLEAPFKTLGTPDVTLRVGPGNEAVIKVWIVAESD
ncbi:MAG: 50S ribosomal protein L9 [Planctomycetota bacterium]|nr:50S ribosomal protein L9 [Planctomycetota bacterium]